MLRGKKILITSGPTRAPLDAVRFISNISTGRFGTLLATAALKKGAKVSFVCGKGSERPKPHRNLKCVEVITNLDVANTLRKQLKKFHYDAVIHAMAVLDFQPARFKKGKTKTKRGDWTIELVPTPKIINQIKKWNPKIVLVGFKLEVGVSLRDLLASARHLLKQSRVDFVLANQLAEGDDSKHKGFLLDQNGKIIGQATGKNRLAKLILDTLDFL